MRLVSRLLWVVFFCAWQPAIALADSSPTPNVYGSLGLNTVPSARMDKTGTARLSLGAADPYVHTQLGFQLTDGFYFGLRQTSEISNLRDDPEKVFPGLDMKVKLFDETKFRPALAVGFQSAFGTKRMAAEYLALSKRYENFDFTAGLGWGRFGTRNSVGNPVDNNGILFDKERQLDGDKPNGLKNWFTGDAGFFAGLEYATPWQGLSLKADLSSDSYKAERRLGQDGIAAYSFGLSYQPVTWADMGVALLDRDTVMARVSFKAMPGAWPFNPARQDDGVPPASSTLPADGQIDLDGYQTTPYQIGQAMRAARQSEGIARFEPEYFGLKARAIGIDRRDFFQAENGTGSAEEIWQHTNFDTDLSGGTNKVSRFIPRFTLRENVSLSEDDAPFIHRTDLVATLGHRIASNFLVENSVRYNLFSNIDHFNDTRPFSDHPVRSNIAGYLVKPLAIERAFVQGFKSFSPDWHVMAGAGYLEEMFAGYHGEILYRPWGRNWAAGLMAANVVKRDYETPLNLGYTGDARSTGMASFYYEIPDTDMTLKAGIGQFLAQDKGGTLALKNRFRNGSFVEAFITATNKSDPDPYGASASLSSGLRFVLPLGSVKYIPDGSDIDIGVLPLGRDAGQQLDIAHNLYDMTEPVSLRHLTRYWPDITR